MSIIITFCICTFIYLFSICVIVNSKEEERKELLLVHKARLEEIILLKRKLRETQLELNAKEILIKEIERKYSDDRK